MNQEVYRSVVDIISKHVTNRESMATLSEQTDILGDLKVNSARLVDIVLDFEECFNIEIDDDEADKIVTIGDAVNLIERLS